MNEIKLWYIGKFFAHNNVRMKNIKNNPQGLILLAEMIAGTTLTLDIWADPLEWNDDPSVDVKGPLCHLNRLF